MDKKGIQSFGEDQLVDKAKNEDFELEEHLLVEECSFHQPLEACQIGLFRMNLPLNFKRCRSFVFFT